MKKEEEDLIFGFHSVSFTKNVTLKKQRIELGKNTAAKVYSCTSVLEHLEAAAESRGLMAPNQNQIDLKRRAGAVRRMLPSLPGPWQESSRELTADSPPLKGNLGLLKKIPRKEEIGWNEVLELGSPTGILMEV